MWWIGPVPDSLVSDLLYDRYELVSLFGTTDDHTPNMPTSSRRGRTWAAGTSWCDVPSFPFGVSTKDLVPRKTHWYTHVFFQANYFYFCLALICKNVLVINSFYLELIKVILFFYDFYCLIMNMLYYKVQMVNSGKLWKLLFPWDLVVVLELMKETN